MRGNMLRMTTQEQLIKTIHRVSGFPLSVLERTARKLTDAGRLPGSGGELLPEDAATLVLALAAGRSPAEAVGVVTAYQAAPLTGAMFTGPGGCTPLVIGPTVPLAVQESAITALGFYIGGEAAYTTTPKSLRMLIHRSAEFPLMALVLQFETGVLQLDYGQGKPIDLGAFIETMILPPLLLDSVAALFQPAALLNHIMPPASEETLPRLLH
jgi:hypothetical protein